jgi:hypothetical protein
VAGGSGRDEQNSIEVSASGAASREWPKSLRSAFRLVLLVRFFALAGQSVHRVTGAQPRYTYTGRLLGGPSR